MKLRAFDLKPSFVLGRKYRVQELVGKGWEGEVYRVVEVTTGITRAAKLFYPERNVRDRMASISARKLERLRKCPIVAQYHHSEPIRVSSVPVTCLISEFVDGEMLTEMIRSRPGGRLPIFEALNLLHAMAVGLECIHAAGEYHGDLHADNVLVQRRGIRFEVKLLDFFHRGKTTRSEMQDDVIDAVRLLYDALGGRRTYASQPPEIKAICCGLKRGLIRRRFPTATRLREHLETFEWGQ